MIEQIEELTFDFHMSRFPINFVDIAKVYSIRDIWIFYAKSATNGVNITNYYLVLFWYWNNWQKMDERFSNHSILIPFKYLKVFVTTLKYRLHISKICLSITCFWQSRKQYLIRNIHTHTLIDILQALLQWYCRQILVHRQFWLINIYSLYMIIFTEITK